MTVKKRLLICADAGVDTGFARVTHSLIEHLRRKWVIDILAVNYHGDPHPAQEHARFWCPTAKHTNDLYGYGRLAELMAHTQADVVLIINDPWIVAQYLQYLPKEHSARVVAYMPVDAENMSPSYVSIIDEKLDHAIAYTRFGAIELQSGGMTTPVTIIPHGVDHSKFSPHDKIDARMQLGLDPHWYIVQAVDRNAPRKRIDLVVHYFCRWVREYNLPDTVKLYYHGMLQDEGYNIEDLMAYYKMSDRLIITDRNLTASNGVSDKAMRLIYNVADVKLSCSVGEG